MHRFFAQRQDADTAALLPEEESHALRVLRLTAGDQCQALMEGSVFTAVIRETSPRVVLTLKETLPSPEPSVTITLYQGIPKGDKMEYIVQKCTEAGVCRVVPVELSRFPKTPRRSRGATRKITFRGWKNREAKTHLDGFSTDGTMGKSAKLHCPM